MIKREIQRTPFKTQRHRGRDKDKTRGNGARFEIWPHCPFAPVFLCDFLCVSVSLCLCGVLFLLLSQGQGLVSAQITAALPSQQQQQSDRKQIVREFISLIRKGDICSLLDRCEVPPLSKAQRRSLFTIFPPRGQTQVRLERDKLLRHYIDRLRELIIVFNRLGISNTAAVVCCPVPAASPCQFITRVQIETPPSPLAGTLSPDLDEKNLSPDSRLHLSFTLTVNHSEDGWKITDLSQSTFFATPP